jgi:hypothetical protein
MTQEQSISVFHTQQAAEKAAKAFLTFHDVSFRKTHDLNELGGQCAALDASLAPLFKEASDLTDYAVVPATWTLRANRTREKRLRHWQSLRAFSMRSVLSWRRPANPESRLGSPLLQLAGARGSAKSKAGAFSPRPRYRSSYPGLTYFVSEASDP